VHGLSLETVLHWKSGI